MNVPGTPPVAGPRPQPPRGVSFGLACGVAFAGPGAWAVDLVARYFLVEAGVAGPHELGVMLIGVASGLIAAASSVLSAGLRQRA